MNTRFAEATTLIAVMVCAMDAYPCKTTRSVSNVDMVREADAIVRVSAEDYTVAPKAPISSTGFDVETDSRIRFKVLEVIRGKVPRELILPGVLVETDDFNDHASPYSSVRPEGRRGSCFARSYRSGGQFLLMLKKRGHEISLDWYPLAPVNEQLHSVKDPWLLWVRKRAKAPIGKSVSLPLIAVQGGQSVPHLRRVKKRTTPSGERLSHGVANRSRASFCQCRITRLPRLIWLQLSEHWGMSEVKICAIRKL